jgi:hypothetical protein
MKTLFIAILAILALSCKKTEVCKKPIHENYFYYVESIDVNDNINRSPIAAVYSVDNEYVSMSIQTDAIDNTIELGGTCNCTINPNDPRCKPMPVTFTNIYVQKLNGYNLVTWEVAMENQVESYKIMRSNDGKNYKEIATIKPEGLSKYSYYDYWQ